MLKIHKKTVLLGLLAAILIIIPFNFSHGASIVDVLGNPVKSLIGGFAWVISTILYIVGFVFSKIVFFGGIFFNWTLDLNAGIIDSPIVSIGWALTRDIANLGFVLLIIMIAFSTILRVGSFQMKTALSKLIIAALLINFSLIGAAVFIDAAGIFTNFFINNAYESTSTQGGISQALATSLSLHQGLQAPPITGETDLSTFGAGIMGYIANIVFLDIMTIVGAITMFALGAMFLLRYINLGILLILLPGAILGWTVGSGVWGDWFKKFLNYTFFGPIASFFIYLALKSTLIFQSKAGTYFTTAVAGDSVLENLAGNIASMIMIVSLLLLGLKSAEELAGALSVGGSKLASGAINGFLRGTANTVLRAGGADLRHPFANKNLFERASEWGKNSKNPLWRGITRPIRQISTETTAGFKKYPGIMSGIFAGIDEGMGGKGRAFREKEETAYKQRTTLIDKSSKDRAKAMGWNETLVGNATNDKIYADAKQEIETHLGKQKGDEKETAEEKTRKHFERENNIEQIIKDTGATRTEVDTAIQKHLGNINEARREIKLNKNIELYQQQIDGLNVRLAMAAPANKPAIQKDIDKLQDKMDKLKDLL